MIIELNLIINIYNTIKDVTDSSKSGSAGLRDAEVVAARNDATSKYVKPQHDVSAARNDGTAARDDGTAARNDAAAARDDAAADDAA